MKASRKVSRDPAKTRQALLESASEEIWRHGFRGASLHQILVRAGVTKGALYHHFKNKQELGYAVVDELLRAGIYRDWVVPFSENDDPLAVLRKITEERLEQTIGDLLRYGCPLGNLAVEMSPLDEGFRVRVESVFQDWRDALTEAFERGKAAGNIKASMQPARAASFMVATFEGAVCTAKSLQDTSILEDCLVEFTTYLSLFEVEREARGT